MFRRTVKVVDVVVGGEVVLSIPLHFSRWPWARPFTARDDKRLIDEAIDQLWWAHREVPDGAGFVVRDPFEGETLEEI